METNNARTVPDRERHIKNIKDAYFKVQSAMDEFRDEVEVLYIWKMHSEVQDIGPKMRKAKELIDFIEQAVEDL